MGEVAGRLADRVVFTEDDSRETPLEEILAELEEGAARAEGASVISISDRSKAIRHAVTSAAPGSVVLLAGKGPEDFILRGDRSDPWDETAEAEAALALRTR